MNSVEKINSDYQLISEKLLDIKEISLLNDFNDYFRKILIISAGSFFEEKVICILTNFVKKNSNNDERMINFFLKKAIDKKYYTLFSWGKTDLPEKPTENANTFWGLFGDSFRKNVNSEIENNILIKESIRSFVNIGHLRNILVHSNFAEYVYEQKTPQELFDLYKSALPFLEYLEEKLLNSNFQLDICLL